jgi:hypothetical protein
LAFGLPFMILLMQILEDRRKLKEDLD